MISDANRQAIEAAGLSFILGMKIGHVPYVAGQWRKDNPGTETPDGLAFTQPSPAGPAGKRRDQVIYYQHRAGHGEKVNAGGADALRRGEGIEQVLHGGQRMLVVWLGPRAEVGVDDVGDSAGPPGRVDCGRDAVGDFRAAARARRSICMRLLM